MAKSKSKKRILVSQPYPSNENSPYFALAEKWGLELEFRKFIQIEGVSTNEFRKQNINPLDFTAVIFTSKYAIDHYFQILSEMKIELPPDMKYFCVSEATSKYLQKYIVIRKRKLFVGERTAKDLIAVIKKHKKEKFLFPCSSIHTPHLTDYMEGNKYNLTKAIIYNTVASDLSGLDPLSFDIICFFSPSGIEALYSNFPNYKQNGTVIAVFGPTTAKSAKEKGLEVSIQAPKPNMPSMTSAIEHYLKEN